MRILTFLATLAFFTFSNSAWAQESFIVSTYGDTLVCDSVVGFEAFIGGKVQDKFERREIQLTKSGDEVRILSNGFDKGRIIMASDSVLLTHFEFSTQRHGRPAVNHHLFFIDRKSYKILHEYLSWYLDGAETIVKYFPRNEADCPGYSEAITEYDAAVRARTKPPIVEGRAVVRAWNSCNPMK